MRFFKDIKFRLTVWYLIVMLLLLVIFGTTAYFMVSYNLYKNLDDSLTERLNELMATLQVQEGQTVFVGQSDELLLIYNAKGALIQRFGPDLEFTNMNDLVKEALAGRDSFLTTVSTSGLIVRFHAARLLAGFNTTFVMVTGRPVTPIIAVLRTLKYILIFSGLAAIILAGAGGLFLASRVLKPVDRMTRAAKEIGESDLSRRINASGDDELGRLASTLNGMFERLEAAFNRQRQFTADASHELRTPLSIVQAESTLALSKERAQIEYRKSLELISQESAYMSSLLSKLLYLARSDIGEEPVNLEEVNLQELLLAISADVEILIREKRIHFSFGLLDSMFVKGDTVKLRQLFLNILENAIRYTLDGGSISISAVRKNGAALVAISDTGIGIPTEHLPFIFERFYRVDKARSRADGGAGLGLAIAKQIAIFHGGRIDVESEIGKGTIFYVSLPLINPGLYT